MLGLIIFSYKIFRYQDKWEREREREIWVWWVNQNNELKKELRLSQTKANGVSNKGEVGSQIHM